MSTGISPTSGITAVQNVALVNGVVPVANGGTGGTANSSLTSLSNSTAILLPKWRRALGRVKAGTGNARLSFLGDSTFYGIGSNNAASGNYPPLSLPTQLSTMFNAISVNANWQSFWGSGGTANGSLQFDSRVTIGGGWGQDTIHQSFGGDLITTSTAGTLTFLPTTNVDTFKVWYVTAAGNGTLSLALNSGTATNQNTAGATGIASKNIVGTLGSNTLDIAYVSGGSIFIIGVEAFNSSQNRIDVLNGGWPTAKSGDWNNTSQPWSPLTFLSSVAADLTLINLGINDWDNSISVATYTANVQALITAALLTGDVILVTPTPSSTVFGGTVAIQTAFVAAMYSLASTNNIPIVDLWARWQGASGGYTIYNALGYYYDTLHPLGLGYNDQAQAVFQFLSRV